MDYKEVWNDICFHVDRCRYDVEDDFQKTVEFLFEKLSWSMRKGEIVPKMPVHFGAKRKGFPDIVIRHNEENVYVIELKRANQDAKVDHENQLRSYMRQLKLHYGVLIGKSLQVYYELPSGNDPAKKVCETPFEEDSEIGIEFIEVLSKMGFSLERFGAFCEKCLADPDKYLTKPKKTKPSNNQHTPKKRKGNTIINRGELTHITMPGSKSKAAKELRGKGYTVCWEQTYDEFFDVRNGGEPHPRMPGHVLHYIKKMPEDQPEGFTKFMSIVFCREK